MTPTLATRAEAIKALGLASARALERLLEKGMPGPKPGKRGGRRYDVAAMQAWRSERKTRQKPTLDLVTERAKLARVQRQLATVKLRQAKGELIVAKDAVDVLKAITGAVRAQLLAVARRCVLEGLPREQEPLVRRLISEALRDLSDTRTPAALLAKARDIEDAA